jgi:hypothetical protein
MITAVPYDANFGPPLDSTRWLSSQSSQLVSCLVPLSSLKAWNINLCWIQSFNRPYSIRAASCVRLSISEERRNREKNEVAVTAITFPNSCPNLTPWYVLETRYFPLREKKKGVMRSFFTGWGREQFWKRTRGEVQADEAEKHLKIQLKFVTAIYTFET